MLYRLAFAYSHVFLFEFNRQYERDLPYPDNYLEVVKSVIKFGDLPLGYGEKIFATLRSGTEWGAEILDTLYRNTSYDDRVRFREVVYFVLTETLLQRVISPFTSPRKQVSKAVDSVIPAYL